MLFAHLGQLLTYGREFARALAMLDQAEQIAHLLGLVKVQLTAQAAGRLAARERYVSRAGEGTAPEGS